MDTLNVMGYDSGMKTTPGFLKFLERCCIMSLCIPGLGQLFLVSTTAPAWFALAIYADFWTHWGAAVHFASFLHAAFLRWRALRLLAGAS